MSGDGQEKVKKVEIPFSNFVGCMRYLFVKGPEKLEDKAAQLRKLQQNAETKIVKQIEELNEATNERIRVHEEKLYKKDLEFSGDIVDIRTEHDRDNSKLVN